MAAEAQILLEGTGWLPEPLRTPGRPIVPAPSVDKDANRSAQSAVVETAANGCETVVVESERSAEDETVAVEPPKAAAE